MAYPAFPQRLFLVPHTLDDDALTALRDGTDGTIFRIRDDERVVALSHTTIPIPSRVRCSYCGRTRSTGTTCDGCGAS